MPRKPTTPDQLATLQRLTQASAAWLLGIAPRTLRDLPAPRSQDGSYSARELLAWHISAVEPAGGDADDGCPELRRYRRIRADLLERDLLERDRVLIPAEAVAAIFSRWATPLRRFDQRLTKKFGREAQQMFHSTMDQCLRAIDAGLDDYERRQ